MQVSFTLNDQSRNFRILRGLSSRLGVDVTKKIVDDLCDRAIGKLHQITPRGRTGRIRGGWGKTVERLANEAIGTVLNKEEQSSVGAMILRIMESGAHYSGPYIYPRERKALRFVARSGEVVFATRARTKDRPGRHIVERTTEYIRTIGQARAEMIMAKELARIIT